MCGAGPEQKEAVTVAIPYSMVSDDSFPNTHTYILYYSITVLRYNKKHACHNLRAAYATQISESLKLYWVLRVLNKFWKYTGVSPLIVSNIKVALSFCWRVIKSSQFNRFKRKLALLS